MDSFVSGWREETVLVVVKTYPVPSASYIELSCTAGITEAGKFIRLFPIPFRLLDDSQHFKKYTWIRLPIKKASDPRPESYKPDLDRLVLGSRVDTKNNWTVRRKIIEPLLARSIEDLRDKQKEDGTSLGIIKPKHITRFYTKQSLLPNWTPDDLNKLHQQNFLLQTPAWILEKIPIEFRYQFECDDPRCKGHDLQCFDWEAGEAYRQWKNRYPDPKRLDAAIMEKFSHQMIEVNDTYFFVGTMAAHPTTWTIVGLFYPKLPV